MPAGGAAPQFRDDFAKAIYIKLIGDVNEAAPLVTTLNLIEQSAQRVKKTTVTLDKETNKFMTTSVSVTKKLGGFRMELLSTMFFGYMLQRTFGGLLQPLLDMMGVFEYFSAILIDILLPVLEPLVDIFFSILDWVDSLDPSIKSLIGSFIVVGAIIGTIIGVVSAVVLGVAGLIAIFDAPLLLTIGIVVAIIGVLVATFLWAYNNIDWFRAGVDFIFAVIVAIIKAAIDIIIATLDFWVSTIMNRIKLIIGLFSGFIDFIVGIFTLDFDKALSGLGKMIGSVYDFFNNMWNDVIGLFGRVGTILWNLLPDWLQKIISGVGDFVGGAVSGVKDIANEGLEKIGIKKETFHFQNGGVVPGVGPQLAVVHGGETIIPAGGSMPINVTINASMNSDMDVRRVAGQVANILRDDLRNR